MDWPYAFPQDFSSQQNALRRQSLDHYARLSYFSSLTPLLVAILIRVLAHAPSSPSGPGSRQEYQDAPGSPFAKARRASPSARWAVALRKLRWWITDDVVLAGALCGRRDEWLLGIAWTAWTLVLCVRGTGDDYILLTKRFAIVPIAQLPAHFLLSLRPLNPYSWALRSSHEHLIRYHRLLGAVLYAFLLAHVLLFNNFYLQIHEWLLRLQRPAVLLGHALALLIHALAGTSVLPRVRSFSYRLFFITHVLIAFALPALAILHARAARPYAAQALAALTLDLIARKISAISVHPARIDLIPGTDLIRILLPLPPSKARLFRSRPAAHIYLSIPPSSISSSFSHSHSSSSSSAPSAACAPAPSMSSPSSPLIFAFLFNPFTVASSSNDSISLIARQQSGPITTTLAYLAASGPKPPPTLSISLEGPYGSLATKSYPRLLASRPDRILLIAGGVGASFAIPLHRALKRDLPCAKSLLVWAVRSRQDSNWAFADTHTHTHHDSPSSPAHSPAARATGPPDSDIEAHDDKIQLYITGKHTHKHAPRDRARSAPPFADVHHARPNLPRIVDDTFRTGFEERVAVLVCGPAAMAREVRAHVRPWVMRGRDVWFHSESFAW